MDSPSIKERLDKRLALVRTDLLEALGRFDDPLLDWAPRPGMRTVAGQIQGIVGTEIQLVVWVKDGRRVSFEDACRFDPQPTTLSEYKHLLMDVRSQTLTVLKSMEDKLEVPITCPVQWFFTLEMAQCPPSEVFVSIAQHEWYHTGQLISYAWTRGDDPYQW